MILKQTLTAMMAVFLSGMAAQAQKPEVTVSLNEQFFDAFLDSMYQNFDPPKFTLAEKFVNDVKSRPSDPNGTEFTNYLSSVRLGSIFSRSNTAPVCDESIKILREINGVRTAVRFREGKIYVPLAFSGNYNPPLVGCVEFAGWAESNIDLEFDRDNQRLIGRVKVLNVNLNGAGGIGGTVIARMLQGSIDRKLNPVEIMRLEKLSFAIPIQNTGTLRMKAVGVRHEVVGGTLNVRITYDFIKG